MQAWFVAIGFVVISLFAGDALAASTAKDISWGDKACCCKAGCPDGSYFCQTMCQLLGASCSLRASSVPDGAALTLH